MTTRLPGRTIRRDAGLYGYERALERRGLTPVAGVDEAGRGASAGPLVAAAVVLDREIPGLADSKLLTAARRERCFDLVMELDLAGVATEHAEVDAVRAGGSARRKARAGSRRG